MAYDVDKFALHSNHPIDKIVHLDTKTIVNDSAAQYYNENKIVEVRYPNPYGKKCFMRARWSINGGDDWQPLEGRIVYQYTVNDGFNPPFTSQNLRAGISVGCSDTEIVIRTAAGYHGNVGAGETFTPISQTFLIEYALMEVS